MQESGGDIYLPGNVVADYGRILSYCLTLSIVVAMTGKLPIYLELPPYLRDFLCDTWEMEEGSPVIPKGGIEAAVLRVGLRPIRIGERPALQDSPGVFRVLCPQLRGVNFESRNHVSSRIRRTLEEMIYSRLDMTLHEVAKEVNLNPGESRRLIEAWMDSHAIDDTETNLLAITKRIQRMRERIKTARRVSRYRSASPSKTPEHTES